LDHALAGDPRVIAREGVNVRGLNNTDLAGPADAIVADLSFISLKLALPAALGLAGSGAWGGFLVKPQFERGPAALCKGGIVRAISVARAAAESVAGWFAAQPGWQVDGLIESPISGGSGNREFLLGGRRG